MSLSNVEFSAEEMWEFAVAAADRYRTQSTKARQVPTGANLVTLKKVLECTNNPDAIAVITGLAPEQLQSINQ